MMKLLLLPLLLLAALIPARSAELELYCTTDLHGHADRLAALGGALRQGGDAVLRVDVGDTAQGTLLSQFSGGRIMIESLNALNFDCWIPGNHDFELGFDRFRALAENFRGVTLGGEWRWNGLSGIPWKLFRKNGVSAAVIGLSDPKMPHRVLPTDGSRFDTPYAALERIMPEIRAAAPDVVILFWHNGLYSSIGSMGNFLRRFPEIDLVVGGHSHQEHPGERAGHVHFVQTGRFAEAAGRIRITLDDRTRRLLRIDSELLRPGTLPDPEVAAAQRPFRSGFDRYASEQVITFPEPVEFPAEIIWNHPFSRLAADAYRAATGADAAFFAMYRPQSEPFRRLDRAGLFQLLPYESRLCAIRLDHEQLRQFLEEQANLARKWNQLPAFSGISLTFTARQEPRLAAAPEQLTLAVTDYTLVSSATLRALLDRPETGWRVFPVIERDAVEQYLKARRAGAPE